MSRNTEKTNTNYRLRFAAILMSSAPLTFASIGIDIVSIDPEVTDPHGFAVEISPEHPYLRIKVAYPHSINDSLEPRYAVVGYWAEPGEIRFMVRSELNSESGLPIELTLTMEPQIADASVDIHYVCVSNNLDICTEGEEINFHIKSIRAYYQGDEQTGVE